MSTGIALGHSTCPTPFQKEAQEQLFRTAFESAMAICSLAKNLNAKNLNDKKNDDGS
jgi:hypothetical protein